MDAGAVRPVALRIGALRETDEGIVVEGEGAVGAAVALHPVDELVAATGFRPDLAPLRELRLTLDAALEALPALAPLIDPNVHSCGTVPPHGAAELAHHEPDFYVVGMKSYGRAPTFLLLTGYEQVRSVVCALVGDEAGARNVELVLPETGVCSSGATDGGGDGCGEDDDVPRAGAVISASGAWSPAAAGGAPAPTEVPTSARRRRQPRVLLTPEIGEDRGRAAASR